MLINILNGRSVNVTNKEYFWGILAEIVIKPDFFGIR